MSPLTLTNRQARQVILHLQGLTRPHHKAFGSGELAGLVEQLGFVQQDSIRWMERAHHMTLFARNRTYRPRQLEKLHEAGELFENWTHDASLIPSQFWRYWKHRFARSEARLRQKFTKWQGSGFIDHVDALREKIRKEGVLKARDLEKPAGTKLDMWQWHDGKAALEFMWRTGQLAVPKREAFQKTYDLSERVIPPGNFNATCSHEAFVDWTCRSAITRLGFGSAKDIASYWELLTLAEVKDWLAENAARHTVMVEVEAAEKQRPRTLYARQDIEDVVGTSAPVPDIMRLLSPFDPVIRDRRRLSWLFGFDYTIEIYVPPEKRKYGYYVFPLLDRDRLIGRIDCQARRAEDCIHVTRLWLEPKIRWSATRQARLESELLRQQRLCNVTQTVFAPDWLAA